MISNYYCLYHRKRRALLKLYQLIHTVLHISGTLFYFFMSEIWSFHCIISDCIRFVISEAPISDSIQIHIYQIHPDQLL